MKLNRQVSAAPKRIRCRALHTEEGITVTAIAMNCNAWNNRHIGVSWAKLILNNAVTMVLSASVL
jgi:hypothetical protein